VKSNPSLLVFHGEFLEDAMRRERVTKEEILAALRASGRSDLAEVGAVVLETQGKLTVLARGSSDGASIRGLKGTEP
jgi:uncharacterized membrane protein YcaP (DUF421 family)